MDRAALPPFACAGHDGASLIRKRTVPLPRSALLPATIAAFFLACASPSRGEDGPTGSTAVTAAPDIRAQREEELRRTQALQQKSEADRLRLQHEIEQLRGDRARLNADLIETSGRIRATEENSAAAEARLRASRGTETALRQSLDARRDVLVEVMAALQRIGRRSPPAVLVRPDDMLEAVRTAILLGAVLPELRSEAELLAGDLSDLAKLKEQIGAERDTLARDRETLVGERGRLEQLVSARQADLAAAERSLEQERASAGLLARQARTLTDLVERMEAENQAARRAAEQAAKAPPPASPAAPDAAVLASNAFRDPARLAPKLAFADARGALALPASGPISRTYGSPDGFGGVERGITISTAAGAVVTAPVDGWVMFAGPFRSYRNLLILNVGGGYHVILIGMDRITVEVGQFVLSGEPVAAMSSMGGNSGGELPVKPGLYVEFRKDGAPIDPGPWWAKSDSEKARG